MNKIRTKENGWSHLPADLLLLVCENLNVPELISFSSVCTEWREVAAMSKHLGRFRHQLPWLMLSGDQEAPSSAQLYSLSDNKLYTIHNQPDSPIANRIFIGSAHGWLVTADERSELSLLNPITRQQIELPPVSTFENIGRITDKDYTSGDWWRDEYGFITQYTAEGLRYMLYDKATISSPPASGDYTVVILLYDPYGFALARAGDKKWTMIDHYLIIYDLVFHKDGKMYTTDWSATVLAWDFGRGDLNLAEVEPELVCTMERESRKSYLCFYLVRAPWGELLLVQRDRGQCMLEPERASLATRRVDIWRIQFDGFKGKFIKLNSLGEHALFLGSNISTCVSCEHNPNIRANCVYLTEDWFKKDRPLDVCIFNLEDGSIDPILPNDSSMTRRPPIWITSSFA